MSCTNQEIDFSYINWDRHYLLEESNLWEVYIWLYLYKNTACLEKMESMIIFAKLNMTQKLT